MRRVSQKMLEAARKRTEREMDELLLGPGCHYPGPDVRNMPSAEVNRLKKQLRKARG